jgi:serine/threonine-protein kinase
MAGSKASPDDTTLAASPLAGKATPMKGTLLAGTYEIVSELGRGAMGIVYEARDRRLDRTVAIKVASGDQHGGALRREAVALAAISHPGLVSIHAAGEHEGADFVVMERLRGVPLDARIQERRATGGAFSPDEIIHIGTEIGCALGAVHAAGLAHRDVKPGNVFLCPPRRVVLTDLGLSRPEYTVGPNQKLMGTPAYMAPEAVTGTVRSGEGPRVDIYALGVMLFELATMRLPFQGGSLMRTLTMQVHEPVPQITRDDLPPSLVELIRGAMAKDPDDRPVDAVAIVRRLAAIAGESRIDGPPARVLVVDDDEDLTALIATVLRATAPTAIVETARSAEEAMHAVRRATPTLLFLDLDLPRINGLELYLLLRERRHLDGCTTVAISARAGEADLPVLEGVGVRRFVPKDGELLKNVRRIVREAFVVKR